MAPYTTEADASGDGADVEEAVETGTLRHRHNAGKDGVDDDGVIRGNGATHAVAGEEDAALVSVERAFEGKEVPTWREQLTIRAFVVSFFLAIMFSIIVMKLNLTTGIIPSLNVSAGLLGFFFVRLWTGLIERAGFLKQPFTRQENTVIQTCVVSAYGIAFSGGFGSYLFGMSEIIAKLDPETNTPENVKDPQIGWIIGFLLLVSFVGLFALVPLRKIMIVDYKLTYPSGTATAYLINGFHTPEGAKLAKKQVKTLGKFFSFSFLWGFFQWFYTAGDNCGFSSFPTLGLEAYKNRFYFDFSPTYVGVGMICPHIVNVSVLLGGILSWGLMWPLIHNKRGSWFSADLGDGSLRGLQGYRVFISIALILGDGLYNFVRVLYHTISSFVKMVKKNSTIPVSDEGSATSPGQAVSFDEQRRTELFLKDQIPRSVAFGGYAAVAAVSIGTLPQIFPELKWYYILLVYVFAPVLAFCNAYGSGLTDWSLASTYGLQDGIPDAGVAQVHVHQPGDRHRHGLRHRALRLLALLQVLRYRKGRQRVPGAVRHRVPEHGHTGRRGLLQAPQELPHALLRILRRGDRNQPDQGLRAEQDREIHPAPDGDGDTVLHWPVLRHRHVRRHRDHLRVEQAEQGQSGGVRACGRLGVDLWRRHLVVAAVDPCSCQGEAADLHEVPIEIGECRSGCLPRKLAVINQNGVTPTGLV
ncbi:unnamed protein product [Alopecurus aequalis]